MAIEFSQENFQQEVLESDIPVLVDFWAPWCGPCRMIAPVVEELASKYEGKIKVGKLNVDDAATLAATYGVQSIPTMIVFKEGKEAGTKVGVTSPADMSDWLDSYL